MTVSENYEKRKVLIEAIVSERGSFETTKVKAIIFEHDLDFANESALRYVDAIGGVYKGIKVIKKLD